MSSDLSFAYPWVLLFLILIPIIAWLYLKKTLKREPAVSYPSLNFFKYAPASQKEKLQNLPFYLRLLGLAFLIIALARPQSSMSRQDVYSEGIDIALLLDTSGSMLAEDFHPNRLEAAKSVMDNFIKDRVSDRIGLVIFADESFTQCPLTVDYRVLRGLLQDVKMGMIPDGTAIGTAIANGVNRLKDSKAKSKVIILLTDGVNNSGEIDPVTASNIAAAYGVRVYAVGVGTNGVAPYPFRTAFGIEYQNIPVEIDESTLKTVAHNTGGRYFRATDNRSLEEIYQEIDRLEKTRVSMSSYRRKGELFAFWLLIGLACLAGEFCLSKTILRRIP